MHQYHWPEGPIRGKVQIVIQTPLNYMNYRSKCPEMQSASSGAVGNYHLLRAQDVTL